MYFVHLSARSSVQVAAHVGMIGHVFVSGFDYPVRFLL